MSAFVCGPDHFKALALFASRQIGGYGAGRLTVDPRYVRGLPESAHGFRGTQLAEVYANILYEENVRSVSARYPNDSIDNLPGPIHKPATIQIAGRDIVNDGYRLKPVDILSMCNCLEYQSCETDDWQQTLAYRLLNCIRDAAVRQLPGYDDAPYEFTLPRKAA
jgi:hypothetical protein